MFKDLNMFFTRYPIRLFICQLCGGWLGEGGPYNSICLALQGSVKERIFVGRTLSHLTGLGMGLDRSIASGWWTSEVFAEYLGEAACFDIRFGQQPSPQRFCECFTSHNNSFIIPLHSYFLHIISQPGINSVQLRNTLLTERQEKIGRGSSLLLFFC